MFVASNFVPLLLAIVLSFPESETATTVFSIKPSDPSFAVEGREFTLKWTYTLDGTLVLSNFFIVSDSGAAELIGKAIGPGNATFETKYQERFRAQATNTQAKLTILSVQRSDDPKYRIAVTPSGAGILTDDVAVIVQYQPFFTFISGNQTVNIGDVVWLNHTTGGFPEPNITWTRLSTNKIVSMPLTITGKQDEGFYRCTADNGIGINATADVFVTVQYQPNLTFISVNQTVNDGDTVWLSCTADGFPVPTITWTRLFTNRIVSMPLSITGKQDEGFYRCITDNGIGNPATADVFVTVQFYRPFSTEFSTNLTNAALLKETFYLMCSAEANPAAEYRLYKEDESVANVTARGQNIGLYATFAVDRVNQTVYKCIPFNSFGDGPTKAVPIIVNYPVQRRGSGNNFTEVEGVAKTFTCPVDGNPEPNITWYSEKTGRKISNEKQYQTGESGCYTCIASNSLGTPVIITQCLIVDPNVTLAPTTTVLQRSPTMAPSTTKPTSAEPGLAGLPWTIIGAVTGGVVVLVIGVSVLTWWVHKQRKCRKDSKIHNSDLERHDGEGGYSQVQGAYAQSGPPAANGTDSAAEQQIEAEAAIPTYAAVDKSKKSKKQADERPPEYAVVDKSQKKEKQEAAAIPTYAAVDKSKKKKKKSHEELPAVYAEVDKSKKKKKKKIDDKNLYENLDEPKKEKKPGELLYADLGDFQNPSMPAVSISPQPLPAIKKADLYERTDYADITQFLKGNATLPPNDGNGDTEMKPKRPSKNKIQGNDKETPI